VAPLNLTAWPLESSAVQDEEESGQEIDTSGANAIGSIERSPLHVVPFQVIAWPL
jgi:hypothetical protein